MKKIAVICASPRKFNPGMFSVDLAFHFLMERYAVQAKVNYFILAHPADRSFQSDLPFEYELAQENLDEIYNSDVIVFWGDFLHSQMYFGGFPSRLIKGEYASNEAEALEIIEECLYLSKMPDKLLSKCLLFGSTQLLDPNNALADKSYLQLSDRLIKGAKGVWVRDIYTALKIARIRGVSVNETHGVDASFFLLASDISKIAGGEVGTLKKVGVFFDRTKINPNLLISFTKDLCAKLEYDAEWLSWFQPIGRKYFRSIKRIFPNLLCGVNSPKIFPLLSSLESYDLIITDTYHLCLNAWSVGTPAICITNGNEMAPGTLRDKKKEVFYFTNEAQDFLVDVEALEGFSRAGVLKLFWCKKGVSNSLLLNRLERCVNNEMLAKSIIQNIQHHKNAAEEKFMSSLKGLLS